MGLKGCRAIGEDSGNQGRCGVYGFRTWIQHLLSMS